MIFLSTVVCFLCVNSLMASETYKAGVLQVQHKELSELPPSIHNAGDTGLDILVLPPLESTANYDEAIDIVSSAAAQAGLYVVAHMYEKARCQLDYESVRSTLVFDRKGAITAVYRKAQNSAANCTVSDSDLVTFATDFGVTFGVLMEEDMMLYDEKHLKGVKNFVMTGDWQAEVSFFNAAKFAPSWSYITNANLVSTSGIYAGKAGLKTGADKLAVAELHKNGDHDAPMVPSVSPSSATFPGEDLRQFVVRPLDLEASSQGYKETVCHRSFCCEFYVKTGAKEKMPESSYSFAAFNGKRPFSVNHNIGTQICLISVTEKPNTFFERVSITANFTKQNSQYPIIQSATVLPTENFKFENGVNGIPHQVTLEMIEAQNIINFGIFGKYATSKLENNNVFEENSTDSTQNEIYDYIFNEDVQEFFDYVWIRLRILIVVVSIYILEMM
ncbi:hypothetical protein PYW07_010363 [Mythimna separata]|uniref:Vanin C-terminal domain-containing protein n=1 Tax=Mythimna separata TaxID=271217 RepID=A0AAD8DLM2_MYTSE|nr:hypothetical protein PYW07_010363 [Mythimna separata]